MATQSVIHSVQQQKSAVVFPVPKQSQQTITQTELVLFLSLRGRLQQLEEQVAAAQEELKARLEAGATVQAGDHIARLDERARRNVAWRACAEDLANTVFGEGKGVAYCDEVLNSTKPTRTVSLKIQ